MFFTRGMSPITHHTSCSLCTFVSINKTVHLSSCYTMRVFAGLIPLLVRLLYPKMRKRSGRLGGKGAPGSARSAILNYLAALDPVELAPLVQLFFQPISTAFQQGSQSEESHLAAALPSSDRYMSLHYGSKRCSDVLTLLKRAIKLACSIQTCTGSFTGCLCKMFSWYSMVQIVVALQDRACCKTAHMDNNM